MQESHAPVASTGDSKRAPPHDEIAHCARDLWIQYGQPTHCDLAIWLEAEQWVQAAARTSREPGLSIISSAGLPSTKPTAVSSKKG